MGVAARLGKIGNVGGLGLTCGSISSALGVTLMLGLLLASPFSAEGEPLVRLPAADGSTYEGGLRNGLYHGHGRLTWPSGAEYLGEFRNGLMHGQGETTRRSGEVHAGGYAFGERHGLGVLTTAAGSRYEGEFRNGEKEGHGTFTYPSGGVYVGDFVNGEHSGSGSFTFSGGTVYEGDFAAGEFDGYGEFRWPDHDLYSGGMRKGVFEGIGRLERDGSVYDGVFADGEFHGKGRWASNGETFEGEFVEGDLTGNGTHRGKSGGFYAGDFVDWAYQGEGILDYADGRRYEGLFVDGRSEGSGKLTWRSGGHYSGEFRDGRLEGEGTYTYPSGKVYRGSFAKGRFHGAGELRWETADGGKRVATGTWEKGKYVAGDAPDLLESETLEAEVILARQPELLERSLAQLQSSEPDVVDLYFLGFGAWGEQDVFMREIRFAQELFTNEFGAAQQVVSLINNRETLDTTPLATVTNLKAALSGISERMNPGEDILFLFMSSHGSEDQEFSVSLGGLPLQQLAPEVLDEALDAAGIPWRVVVVSACYSGSFVAPLANERTLVMTASSTEQTSFGCSNEADFTYFGGALLRDAIPEAESFVAAFEKARTLVEAREKERELEHSEPQIATSPAIERQLSRWRSRIAPAAVPAKLAPEASE